jgi:Sensors of blue-light using FAD
MALQQLVYVSTPFGFDRPTLAGILVGARANNARDGLTGCLICRADIYMQLLEGPDTALAACWGRIRVDDRHGDVTRRVLRPVTERMFPGWAMRDDPADSWIWDQDAVARDAHLTATPEEILSIFARVAATA